jgi:hypothetical protein
MPHTYVKPARVTFHSTELATNVRRVYAYAGYCACGWEGERRKMYGEARWDTRVHRHEEHRS